MSPTSPLDLLLDQELKMLVKREINAVSHIRSETTFRTSSTGQKYAVLMLEGRVYNTVYLFVENPWPLLGQSFKAALRRKALISSHLSTSGTEDYVKRIHELFKEPTLDKIRNVFPCYTFQRDRRFAYRRLDKLWSRQYNELLQRGDIVLCRWMHLWGVYHAGIYIGNGKVIHRSGGGQMSKVLSVVKEGDLINDFAGGPNASLWVMKFIVRIRSNEEIAASAEDVLMHPEQYKKVIKKYALIKNDCQKFVTHCALADFFEWDMPFKANTRF